MRPIRIAAQLHPQHGTYADIRQAVLTAELMGFDICYTWDHFYPLYGPPDGPHLECWSLLAAWAEATRRIEIGPLVTCNSYRNPELLADMARTVDQISGGRTILGIGAGWFRRDYDEYGYPFGTVGQRLADLERSLPRIVRRLERLNPPPVRPMPLLIAGIGERRTLRLVAQHADSWHAAFPEHPTELEPKIAALGAWCDVEGRDPTTIEWAVGVEAWDLDRFLADDAPTYVEMGFRKFTLGFNGPSWTVTAGQAWLDWRDRLNTPTTTPAEDGAPVERP